MLVAMPIALGRLADYLGTITANLTLASVLYFSCQISYIRPESSSAQG